MDYVYDANEIKGRVPFESAAAELDIHFGEDGRALCPFHDDVNNPNFELMGPGEDGFEWAYCRACGTAVDVIELTKRVLGIPFYEALVRLSKLHDALPPDVRPSREQRPAAYVPDETWETRMMECQARVVEHMDVGLLSYAYGFTDEESTQEQRRRWDEHLLSWGWGLDEAANIVIPHRDLHGQITCVKVRYRDRTWRAFGTFPALYGSWKIKGVDDESLEAHSAVLCEGESDCVWAAAFDIPRVDCLALPAGAGSYHNDWVGLLEQYEIVYLAQDNDIAGRESVEAWSLALGYNIEGPVCRVQLEEGQDLRSSGRGLPELLSTSERITIE